MWRIFQTRETSIHPVDLKRVKSSDSLVIRIFCVGSRSPWVVFGRPSGLLHVPVTRLGACQVLAYICCKVTVTDMHSSICISKQYYRTIDIHTNTTCCYGVRSYGNDAPFDPEQCCIDSKFVVLRNYLVINNDNSELSSRPVRRCLTKQKPSGQLDHELKFLHDNHILVTSSHRVTGNTIEVLA